MNIVDFDPGKHEAQQLYVLRTVKEKGGLATVAVPADVSFEDAKLAPWHYVVDADETVAKAHDYQWQLEIVPPGTGSKGGPGSGHHGHAGRPGKRGGSLPGKGGGGGAETGRYQTGDDLEGSPFGSWAASMDDQLKGYRGVNPSGIGFGSTEGKGVYLAKDKELAQFFAGDQGQVKRYKFHEPKKPLVVDEEPLYLLSEADELEDPPRKGDSPWLAANKRAVKRAYEKTGGKWDMDLAAEFLTEEIKRQGHDAVFVRSAGEEWVVLFDPKALTGRTI